MCFQRNPLKFLLTSCDSQSCQHSTCPPEVTRWRKIEGDVLMKSCFVLSITKSGTQPSHSSLRVLQPPLPPSSQPSPFSLQPPSPSPLDHITLFLLMTSEHLQHFVSFPPPPYSASTISLILSQILFHLLVFCPSLPRRTSRPFLA